MNWITKVDTPCYVIDEKQLRKNLELLKFVRSVRSAVLVSDYIFSDAGEYDPMTERYRRALAGIDRMLARECDTVVELAAGRRIVHKGVLPF